MNIQISFNKNHNNQNHNHPQQEIARPHVLSNNQQVENEQRLSSPNEKYHAVVQGDGNFVVYESLNKSFESQNAVWASDTWKKGHGPFRVVMQDDGNLVLYDSHSKPTWASGTNNRGKKGHYCLLQNDGHLVVYDGKNEELWRSGKKQLHH